MGLTRGEMAQLYAYYKQGTQDPPIADAPAPSLWDVKARRIFFNFHTAARSSCARHSAALCRPRPRAHIAGRFVALSYPTSLTTSNLVHPLRVSR